MPIKTALVGFGKAGMYLHAPFIHADPDFHLAVILERTPRHAAQAYSTAKVVNTYEAILEDSSIELIVLATPNHTHAAMAEQALQAGKHVVVDKPFTIHAADAKHLRTLALKTGKHICVYQNRRWDGDFLTVHDILQKKLLGEINSIESRFDRYRPEPRISYWKESAALGNGLWYDLGPHLMDQAFQLLGRPESYTAIIKKQRPGATGIDYFDVVFAYGKLTYRIHAGMLEQDPTPRWLIKGSKGTYMKFGTDPQEACLNAGELPAGIDWGKEDERSYGVITYKDGRVHTYPTQAGDYRKFYRNVYQAIRNQQPFPVTLDSAVELVGWLERLSQPE
ncbi:MAG: Gfo/Idh/MocA family oxidoreductase [Cytophaga sp.]